jgi:hypothetical protein
MSAADKPDEPIEPERVGRLAQRDRLDRLPLFGAQPLGSAPCLGCQALIPRDLSLCFYCGHPARPLTRPRPMLLVIDAVHDPDTRAELLRVLGAAAPGLDGATLASALGEPPAVFAADAAPELMEVACARLQELGVVAWYEPLETTSAPLMREVFEAALRERALVKRAAAAAALLAALALWSPVVGLPALMVAALALYARQRVAYVRRYHVMPLRMLDELSGLGARAAHVTRALKALHDETARHQLTACLISYHAIWRQLTAADPMQRRLLGRLRADLADLLDQLLDACIRYGELQAFAASHDLAQLDAQLAALEAAMPEDPRALELRQRQLAQRRQQRATLARVLDGLPLMREQLGAMAASLEALRARTIALTLRRSGAQDEDADLSALLFDLDEEVEIFEQTVTAISAR